MTVRHISSDIHKALTVELLWSGPSLHVRRYTIWNARHRPQNLRRKHKLGNKPFLLSIPNPWMKERGFQMIHLVKWLGSISQTLNLTIFVLYAPHPSNHTRGPSLTQVERAYREHGSPSHVRGSVYLPILTRSAIASFDSDGLHFESGTICLPFYACL